MHMQIEMLRILGKVLTRVLSENAIGKELVGQSYHTICQKHSAPLTLINSKLKTNIVSAIANAFWL